MLIIGVGSLGTFAIHNTKYMLPPEVEICAVDISSSKLEDAREAGAHHTVLWNTSSNVSFEHCPI